MLSVASSNPCTDAFTMCGAGCALPHQPPKLISPCAEVSLRVTRVLWLKWASTRTPAGSRLRRGSSPCPSRGSKARSGVAARPNAPTATGSSSEARCPQICRSPGSVHRRTWPATDSAGRRREQETATRCASGADNPQYRPARFGDRTKDSAGGTRQMLHRSALGSIPDDLLAGVLAPAAYALPSRARSGMCGGILLCATNPKADTVDQPLIEERMTASKQPNFVVVSDDLQLELWCRRDAAVVDFTVNDRLAVQRCPVFTHAADVERRSVTAWRAVTRIRAATRHTLTARGAPRAKAAWHRRRDTRRGRAVARSRPRTAEETSRLAAVEVGTGIRTVCTRPRRRRWGEVRPEVVDPDPHHFWAVRAVPRYCCTGRWDSTD
eukprot:7386079-Prymnesium_polylepis.1